LSQLITCIGQGASTNMSDIILCNGYIYATVFLKKEKEKK